jgi:NADPH-dependent curcumin reductase
MSEPAVKQIVLASRPTGVPTRENFRLEKAPMPELPQGGLLLRVLYLSLDRYMRGRMDDRKSYAKPVALGEVMTGESVCEVIASDQAGYAVGDIVLAPTGGRTHAAPAGAALRKLDRVVASITTGLGVLGMPGFTAYAGLNLIGKPKPGETVAVAAASGPVGSLVGQLAKLAGARAVGIAGGPEKCGLLLEEFCFDAAVDHRASDFAEKLAASCPNGIDVYFENVGGAIWQAVLPLLNKFARVPVCGLIAQYNTCALSAPLSPMGASAIARISPTASRMRRQASLACWKAATSAKRWCASRHQREHPAARRQIIICPVTAEENRVLTRKEQSSGFTQRRSP